MIVESPSNSKLSQILMKLKDIDEAAENQTESKQNNSSTVIKCSCKKSKCLKLYCQCFSSKKTCNPLLCSCESCENTFDNKIGRTTAIKTALDHNFSAFESKFVSMPVKQQTPSTESISQSQQPISHKSGCRCRKSNCIKKYCECFEVNARCSRMCECRDCGNGRGSTNSVSNPCFLERQQLFDRCSSIISAAVNSGVGIAERDSNPPPPSVHVIESSNATSSSHHLLLSRSAAANDTKSSKPPLDPISTKRKRRTSNGDQTEKRAAKEPSPAALLPSNEENNSTMQGGEQQQGGPNKFNAFVLLGML